MNVKQSLMVVALACLGAAANAQQLTSPDGKLKMDFSLNAQGAPVYALTFSATQCVR